VAGSGVFSEIEESFISFHGVVRLAIHHGDWARVRVLVRVQAGDQLIKLFQVGVMARLLERVNHDRMNLACLRCPGFLWQVAWGCFRAG